MTAVVTYSPAGSAPPPADWRPGDFLLIRNPATVWGRSGTVDGLIRYGEYLRYRRAGVGRAQARQLALWSHAVAVAKGSLIEAVGKGVVRSPLSKYTDADFLYVRTDLTDAQRDDAAAFLEFMVGTRYAYLTDVAIGLSALTGTKLVLMRRGQCICSGLVAAMLGTYAWRADPAFVTPSDLSTYHGISQTLLLDP